jgi:hypothetical protein
LNSSNKDTDAAGLANFFNFEISGLADRFLMEIAEKVNMQREVPECNTSGETPGANERRTTMMNRSQVHMVRN